MIARDASNLYFNPGCALMLYRRESAEKMFAYLKKNFPEIQWHDTCCRHAPKLPKGSVIVNVCAGCDKRFSSRYPGISTISLWEILAELGNFPFPDYGGMEVSVHDPCPVRGKPVVHRAVRKVLERMNLNVIETEKNGTKSLCCGDSLYPSCDMETIAQAMKKRAESMPCDQVVVYCVSCIKAMYIGGKTPRYLIDLLTGDTTEPQEYRTDRWHEELEGYIAEH